MVPRLVIRLVTTDRLSDGLSEGLADGLADGLPNQVAERARRRHVDGEVLKRRMLDAAPNQTVVVGVQLLGTTWINRYENVRPKTGQLARWSRRARGTDLHEMNGMSPGRPPGPCVSISRWADLRVAIRHYSLLASSYELGLGPPACVRRRRLVWTLFHGALFAWRERIDAITIFTLYFYGCANYNRSASSPLSACRSASASESTSVCSLA
jgi:hypothetical protein